MPRSMETTEMAESPWRYSVSAHRFRDSRNGRFISATTAVDLRDGFAQARRADLDALVAKLAGREITVQAWEADTTQAIRSLYTAQYAYGRGGLAAMSDADYTAADALVEAQRAYLRTFTLAVQAGTLSEAQIRARARLYAAGSVQAYERGRAAAYGVHLPAHPGDGSTPCKTNCRCHWRLTDKGDTVEATWVLGAAEHCTGCKDRARLWAPLVLSRPATGRVVRLWRAVA